MHDCNQPTVIRTTMAWQEANCFNTAGMTMKRCNAALCSDIPQCNVLVSASSHKLVLTRHPVDVKYCIPMCLPICNKHSHSSRQCPLLLLPLQLHMCTNTASALLAPLSLTLTLTHNLIHYPNPCRYG